MSDQETPSVPAVSDADEVAVSFHDDGLLVGGEPAAVESYLERLRGIAGRTVQVVAVDRASGANAAAMLAGIASIFGQTSQYVQLHPDSVSALKTGNVIPGTDGFFRMMTRADDGAFLSQLQWRPATFGPEVMMGAQMLAVQIALQQSIAKVEDAVKRVEGKVGAVLDLAHAARAGDVIGNNLTIARMVESLDRFDSLPEAYWDSVAPLGPMLNVTIEQLRDHIARVLRPMDREKLPVQERATKLHEALEDQLLGETLSLLVVAQDSLYKWQRLNLARIKDKEPDQLLRAIDEARELIQHQLKEDAVLYNEAKTVLDRFAKPDTVEGLRYWAVRDVAKQRALLRKELDSFAEARRHNIESWDDFHIPGFVEAANAVLDDAKRSTGRALTVAGEGLTQFGTYLARQRQDVEAKRNKDDSSPADER